MFAFGLGIGARNAKGALLECYFPAPCAQLDEALAAAVRDAFAAGVTQPGGDEVSRFANAIEDSPQADAARSLQQTGEPIVCVVLETDVAIEDTASAYLKLHLLSHRLALPNSLNLDGIFAHLPNNAWTSAGAIDPAELSQRVLEARRRGESLEVFAVDKFPRMTNYVIPSGVRIADASRIRLGAYLGDGTTVMHEGFVNFNAGALGPNMVEGRISQGVTLGAHSDLGGSASTMGTLSGGGEIRISIGEHCLIGANAGTGIPLGDRCTIEAGLYITAGTPVELMDPDRNRIGTVKARELAGKDDLLFIRNGLTGCVECRQNRNAIELNDQLHAHN